MTSPPSEKRCCVVMLAPSLNPANQGFRYRCAAPTSELIKRGWNVRIETIDTLGDADMVIAMSDVCLGKAEIAEACLSRISAARAKGARVVVTETDHRSYNPLGNADLARKAGAVRRLYLLAHEIIVTTSPLGDAIKGDLRADTSVTVIPDALELPEDLRPSGVLRRLISFRHIAPRLELLKLRHAIMEHRARGCIPIFWFGGHGTGRGDAGGMLDLLTVKDTLESLHRQHPISLTVISNSPQKFASAISVFRLPTHYIDWNRLTFHDALRLHEVCILPIRESPWTLCKSNNRLVTAIHSGLISVANLIPSYLPFMELAQLGDPNQQLPLALAEISLLRALVPARQQIVQSDWGMSRIGDQWEALMGRHSALLGARK